MARGNLLEQNIPTLFNGISKQPQSVRFSGQVDDAENVSFSVETGGFSKRLGSRIKKKLSLPVGHDYRLHVINRDAGEKYYVIIGNGGLKVYDKDFNERYVNFGDGSTSFLSSSPENYALLTSVDYTFIANRQFTVQMDPASTVPAPENYAVLYVRLGYQGLAGDEFKVKVNGVDVAYRAATETDDAKVIATILAGQLSTNLGYGWYVNFSGSYIFIRPPVGTNFTIEQESPVGDTGIIITKNRIETMSEAPARAIHGMMLQVKSYTGDGFWVKFTADDGVSGRGWWTETVAPGSKTSFLPWSMPWGLVRNPDGSFSLSTLSWNPKKAGSDVSVPPPDFVGNQISDLVSTRSRLGIVAGETVFFSNVGDVFNFWPNSSTELLDSDPFGVTNTTNSVSKFFFAVPFRRSVFIMADNAQFEIGGDVFTPSRAAIDLATSYSSSTRCRPVAVGDELYFPAEVGRVSSILSYVYDEASVSETANDVTKHVSGLIPSPVVELQGDSVNSQVYAFSEATRDTIYVHTFFYQGTERAQSAWGRYRFPGMTIRSTGMLDGVLVLLVEWQGSLWLIEVPSEEDEYSSYSWVPRIDHQVTRTGTYNSTDGYTYWSIPYTLTDPVVITSNQFPTNKRMLSLDVEWDATTAKAKGDWSGYPVLIGDNFNAYVVFSKQFMRDANGTSITNGRLQLRYMTLRFDSTGYFTVDVTPEGRDARRWTYAARTLGSTSNRIQRFPIESGKFRFGVGSNGETVTIKVGSDKFMPFTITSAAWIGFFNEVSRQG